MKRKARQKRLYERIIIVWLLIILVTIWLLMTRLMGTAAGYQTVRSETVIPMIETVEPSVKADKMHYSVKEEAGVYDNTPETETAEMAIVEDEGVVKEYLITENETAKSNPIEIDRFDPEWHYYITAEEIRLIALIAELEDRNAMSEIAETILNRVNSPKFPDSVYEVIYQPKQFQSVSRITEEMQPSDEAVQATLAVFRDGVSTVGDSLFFAEKSIAASSIAKGLCLVEISGGTAFYEQK